MNRRTALALLLVLGALGNPPDGSAQKARKPARIGVLSLTSSEAEAMPVFQPFISGMRERGYVLGEHYVLEIRYSGGDARRFPALADELIALKPDVLLGIETTARAFVAKTSTIPIVLYASIDPVAAGLVKSLARPGTNVTGMSGQYDELTAKQLELLVEMVPTASRIAMLMDPFWSARESFERNAKAAAAAKRLSLSIFHPTNSNEVQEVFAEFEKRRPDALLVAVTGLMGSMTADIHEGARRLRLPSIGYTRHGGLISYQPNVGHNLREAAEFVDRILKGAKPADLPVRQATGYELILNLKTAREIGITFPPSILVRADRVIE